MAPSTLDPIKLSKVAPFCVIAVAFRVAAVTMPTSKFDDVINIIDRPGIRALENLFSKK